MQDLVNQYCISGSPTTATPRVMSDQWNTKKKVISEIYIMDYGLSRWTPLMREWEWYSLIMYYQYEHGMVGWLCVRPHMNIEHTHTIIRRKRMKCSSKSQSELRVIMLWSKDLFADQVLNIYSPACWRCWWCYSVLVIMLLPFHAVPYAMIVYTVALLM